MKILLPYIAKVRKDRSVLIAFEDNCAYFAAGVVS
jgi:hypothetical protein